MAQGVLQDLVQRQGLEELIDCIDSAGTGAYHVGADPDPRTLWTLKEHGIFLSHSARQLCDSDFADFDFILAMDRQNLQDILSKAPRNCPATICLYGDFNPSSTVENTSNKKLDKIIKDPYYGSNNAGFETAYTQSKLFGQGLIQYVKKLSES